MLKIEDVSEENLEDVFKVCGRAFEISPHNEFDYLLYKKGKEIRRRWLTDMLEQHGHCIKIAYLDGKPLAQIQFCPEEVIPYIRNPRKDVLNIMCVFNPIPEAQRKGVASELVRTLANECNLGLSYLDGRPGSFLATLPFPTMGRFSLTKFYEKNGFKQGHKEMYLEIKGEYVTREIPEFRPLNRDLDRTILLYNPACEWGYFYAYKIKEIVQRIAHNHPVEIYNVWENPEEYIKRSMDRVTAGRAIVKGRVASGGIFWTDRDAFCREIKELLR